MRSPSPDDKPYSEIVPMQIEHLRVTRSVEIQGYLAGTLSVSAREQFVSEITSDHNLRLAVISMRDHRTLVDPNVTELSVRLLDSLCEAVTLFNSTFPNSPGLHWLDDSDTCESPRSIHYAHALEIADQLLSQGGLEDLALENRWIVQTNRQNAFALGALFAAGGRSTAEEQQLVSQFSVPWHLSSETGALLPISLPSRRSNAGDLSNASLPEQEQQLVDVSIVSPEILLLPLGPRSAEADVSRKLLEVEKLLGRIARQGVKEGDDLLQKVFLQYLPGPIHGPTNRYSAAYFCRMAEQVARVANENDHVWQAISQPLLLSINVGILGIDSRMVPEHLRRPILVTMLAEMPNRLNSSEVLAELAELSLTQIPSVACAICPALGQLKSENAVPLLINIIRNHPGPELQPRIERNDPFDTTQACLPEILAMMRLGECDAAHLKGARLAQLGNGEKIPLAIYLVHYLSVRASSSATPRDFTPLDEALFDLIAVVDNRAAESCARQRLSQWSGSWHTFPFLAATMDRHFSDGLAAEVVSALGRTIGRDVHRLPPELIELFRDQWGLTHAHMMAFGGLSMKRLLKDY